MLQECLRKQGTEISSKKVVLKNRVKDYDVFYESITWKIFTLQKIPR